MISRSYIKELATKYQTIEENVAREYCQHLFLSYMNKLKGSEKLLFKGGTALRIIFNSPRFSEDLDFSAINSGNINVEEINHIIDDVLGKMLIDGIQVEKQLNPGTKGETTGGYFAIINMQMLEFSTELQIQVSFRKPDEAKSNRTIINNDFVPSYLINFLDESILVAEKVKALLERKLPRDFFDLYFILKHRSLVKYIPREPNLKNDILSLIDNSDDFEKELKLFLPINFHSILKDFKERLKREVDMYISN